MFTKKAGYCIAPGPGKLSGVSRNGSLIKLNFHNSGREKKSNTSSIISIPSGINILRGLIFVKFFTTRKN